ncbi:hypothetical protein ElyMa_000181900 [Elysia marginata]|uniref:Uncharacterized protein n=1 Tax=Elysia marginata TaxID=1093978 RepID=A0AAV4EUU2_9GAST|nr:hypothetical protein ElyMa_000181900 [Elysia marginata]
MGKETQQNLENHGANLRSYGHLVPVDKRLAPMVIAVDHWKKILISLGFEIEQPDGYHTLEYVDVLVGAGVMTSALDGMIHLLTLVNSLPWNIIRMILTLTHEDAVNLCSLTEAGGQDLHEQVVSAKALMSRYPEEMAHLGFRKDNHTVVKTISHCKQARLGQTISLILKAIFEEGPPDMATFV